MKLDPARIIDGLLTERDAARAECERLKAENAMLRRSQCVRAEGQIIACAICETATPTGNDGCCMDCWMAWQERSPEREVIELEAEVERMRAALAEVVRIHGGLSEQDKGFRDCWTVAREALSPRAAEEEQR